MSKKSTFIESVVLDVETLTSNALSSWNNSGASEVTIAAFTTLYNYMNEWASGLESASKLRPTYMFIWAVEDSIEAMSY